MGTRIVFMGSPEFALPSLRLLAQHYSVTGVVTQPDRPAGRGKNLAPPPVKVLADELSLPTIQPERLKEPAAMQALQTWAPDLIVVAAFGQILRTAVLELPRFGCVNVHASLLPRWRGAAPIQAALLAGDDQTGVTIMCMDRGVDTGGILSQRSIPIQPDDTAGMLSERLAELGAELLLETLPGYLSEALTPQAQDESQATYAPMLKKEDGLLDFSQTAAQLARRVQAYNPWPGAYFFMKGTMVKVHRAHTGGGVQASPGQRLVCENLPAIGTAQGVVILDQVQPAGKKPMPGADFLRGLREWAS